MTMTMTLITMMMMMMMMMMMIMYWLLQELVRQGIPQPFRGIAWQLLCGVDLHCVEKRTYSTYLKKTSAFEKTISRDITRTFPSHDLFKDKDGVGQESLFNVMKVCCMLLYVLLDISVCVIFLFFFGLFGSPTDPASLLI